MTWQRFLIGLLPSFLTRRLGAPVGLYELPARILASLADSPVYRDPEADGVLDALLDGDMGAAMARAYRLHATHTGDDERRRFAGLVAMAAERYETAAALLATATRYRELQLLLRCHAKLGDVAEAKRCLDRLLALSPGDAYSRAVVGLLERRMPVIQAPDLKAWQVLRGGDLARGFALLAKHPDLRPVGSVPAWDGSRVRHLVVTNRLGDGDALMFLRFAAHAAQRVDRLSLLLAPRLVPLFRSQGFETFGFYGLFDALEGVDAQVDAALLPSVLGPEYGQPSYLRINSARTFGPGLHVGVNWTASEYSGRSVPAAELGPLERASGATFHCLAYGRDAQDRPAWVLPLSVGDYLDTARTVAGLDLVITVDTSLAHLAGSLGRPVWLGLPGPVAHWTWGASGAQSLWYPQTRLFRGPRCFEDMAEALDRPSPRQV